MTKDYEITKKEEGNITFLFYTSLTLLGVVLLKEGVGVTFANKVMTIQNTDTVTFRNVITYIGTETISYPLGDSSITLLPVYMKYDSLGRRRVTNGRGFIAKQKRKSRAVIKECFCELCY